MAPEVLEGVYSSQADVWSVGVITYMLLSSINPFYHKSKRCMVDMIRRGKLYFDDPVWKPISNDAKDFVRKLLVVDPTSRLDGPNSLLHSWIVKREQMPNELPLKEDLEALGGSLVSFRCTSKLIKLALTVIAHRSTSKETLQLRKVFGSLDMDKKGYLSYDEFKQTLEMLNHGPEEIEAMLSSVVRSCPVDCKVSNLCCLASLNSTRVSCRLKGPRPR
jgi:calcium-dependent protein kinase